MAGSVNEVNLGQCVTYGSIWLNQIFGIQRKKIRLAKKLSIRFSLLEIIFIPIFSLIFGLIFWGLMSLPLIRDIIPSLTKIILIVILGLVFGYITGKWFARLSPYKQETGEGLSTFFKTKFRQNSYLLGYLVGRKAARTIVMTRIDGHEVPVEAIVWTGTARCPRVPSRDSAETQNLPVWLLPQDKPTGALGLSHSGGMIL